MIKTLIIDDERHASDRLERLLQQQFSHALTLAGTAASLEEGVQAITTVQPDLVFLDVHLHNKTGFDLLQQVPQHHHRFDCIFTTAYEQYAIQAFKFSAIDYLLKPVAPEDLQQAVDKVIDKKEKTGLNDRLSLLLHNVTALQSSSKRICIPVMNGMVFVKVSDIVRCESEINYTRVYLNDQQKILVPKTLKEFEELLLPYDFYRVHHSHLINLQYVKSYTKGKGGYVTLQDHTTIEVSTRRKEDFIKRLANL